jgi:hypothetical protein
MKEFNESTDGARNSYGQGLMAKKKKLVGASKLNFYFFLPYIFYFLERKKISHLIIFFRKLGGLWSLPAPFPPSLNESIMKGNSKRGCMYAFLFICLTPQQPKIVRDISTI